MIKIIVKADIKGMIGKVDKKLDALNQGVHEAGRMLEAGIADDIATYPTVDTGDFLRSVTTDNTKAFQSTVFSNLYYAPFIEYGCFFNETKTKILTKRGYTKLYNVREGDEVYTHKGRWRKVLKKLIFNVQHRLQRFTIKTRNKSKLTLTANHPILTKEGWKRTDKIIIGEKIISVRNDLPFFHWRNFKKEPHNKGKITAKRINKKCLICNKHFFITKNSLKFRPCNYCSRKCYHKYGSNNPNYGKRHLNLHSIKHRKKQSDRMKGNKNPMFHKRVPRLWIGYRADLGHMCKSTWEANYARVLKYQKIYYDYEPKTFELSNGTTYTPDFFVYKNNGFYIEIKGYVTNKFLNKFSMFKKEYPEIDIRLFEKDKYKLLENEWKNKIFWESGVSLRGNDLKFMEDEIIEIKKTHYSNCKIYNLYIEEDNSFVANNIVTHNTSPHFPPVEALKGWAKRQLGDEKLAFVVARAISRTGTKPRWHFRRTSLRMKQALIDFIQMKVEAVK